MKCLLNETEVLAVMQEAKDVVSTYVKNYGSNMLDGVRINFSWDKKIPTSLIVDTFQENADGEAYSHRYNLNNDTLEFEFKETFAI